MTQPELSAIIIVHNGMRFLPDCLSTLTSDLKTLSHEIIAVDNGSSDGSADFIAKEYPAIKLIRNANNMGFAKAVNAGLGKSSGEYVYILNQDLRFRLGSTRALLERIKRDPSIGLIGPKYVGFDGQLQKSARSFPGLRHVWYDALLLPRFFPNNREFSGWRMGWFDHERELYIDQPMGSAMLIPRPVIEQVGLLDERFPIFFNDVDYCRRIRAAGYKIVYYPEAVVEHFVGGSTRQYPARMAWESHRSMYRYLEKYTAWYQRPLLWLTGVLLLAGVFPKMLRRGARQR